MKNIVICCDGTSNDFGDQNSNVVKLFSVLDKIPGKQIVYYDPGVGTPSSYDAFNPVTKKVKYILGLAFGYGLSENIMDAYRFLMQCYEENDRIFLFGFSRGAYTVRAIAGLLDTCGLLHANSHNLVPEAMRIYYDRENRYGQSFKKTFGRDCPVHFLGLWDTVTSIGWVYNPLTLQSTTNNASVSIVRHAIAIDERRAFFRQNLWGSRFENDPKVKQDVKQVWFAGVHADIGGMCAVEKRALSNITLEWMLSEAIGKQLLVSDLETARQIVRDIPDPHLKDLAQSLKGFWRVAEFWPKIVRVNKTRPDGKTVWVSRLYVNKGRPRRIAAGASIHESVLLRLRGRADYRPTNLLGKATVEDVPTNFRIEPWVKL